ncbi:integrase arm-type DNA-binding domain-containing protein [Shinella daejeonensis]|nr:integrase arm-type DNA-binding domain-containing protein [Shinella daejeonensis]
MKVKYRTDPDTGKKTAVRWDWMDTEVRGFGVRVGTTGKRTFMLFTRFPGSHAPTRAELGEYTGAGGMTLAQARKKAGDWREKIRNGVDPRDEQKAELAEKARRRENTFKSVVEDYIADLPTRKRNRHIEQDEREIRRELLDPARNDWMDKPIAEITDEHIAELIGAIRDRPAVGMAYNSLGHIKSIFDWAMWPERRRGYGLTDDPTRNLKPKYLRLPSKTETARTRVLSDDELRAYWNAADSIPYPLGPFFKLLLLTGQRKSEVSDAERSEFDVGARLWTIPEVRVKMGQDHLLPMSSAMIELVEGLPKQGNGDFIFSDRRTKGAKPINGFGRAKKALDEKMLECLREKNPDAELRHFVLHDVRRTVRTRLSALTKSEVAEHVIGHSKQGIQRVYNYYEYLPEMREALEAWAGALDRIVNPPTGNNVLEFAAGS